MCAAISPSITVHSIAKGVFSLSSVSNSWWSVAAKIAVLVLIVLSFIVNLSLRLYYYIQAKSAAKAIAPQASDSLPHRYVPFRRPPFPIYRVNHPPFVALPSAQRFWTKNRIATAVLGAVVIGGLGYFFRNQIFFPSHPPQDPPGKIPGLPDVNQSLLRAKHFRELLACPKQESRFTRFLPPFFSLVQYFNEFSGTKSSGGGAGGNSTIIGELPCDSVDYFHRFLPRWGDCLNHLSCCSGWRYWNPLADQRNVRFSTLDDCFAAYRETRDSLWCTRSESLIQEIDWPSKLLSG